MINDYPLKRYVADALYNKLAGVISRRIRGRSSLIKIADHFGGRSPHENSSIGFAFQSVLYCAATWLLRYF